MRYKTRLHYRCCGLDRRLYVQNHVQLCDLFGEKSYDALTNELDRLLLDPLMSQLRDELDALLERQLNKELYAIR